MKTYMCVSVGINVKSIQKKNAVHARMPPYGVYREGLQRVFELN
jgi:hypothetical protein